MKYSRKFTFAAAALTFIFMASSTVAVASEANSSHRVGSETEQKMQEIREGSGQGCASASKVKIRVDGRSGDFTLNAKGELVSGPAEPSFAGCGANNIGESTDSAKTISSTFSFAFSPARSAYIGSNAESILYAQQSYTAGLTTAYRWEPSAQVRSVIYGEALQAYAFKNPDNCSYNKPGYDADYIFHWSCAGQSSFKPYYLWGTWSFRASGPGWSGYADITWDFSYQITYV